MQLGIAVYVLNVTYDDFEGSFLQEAINIAAKLWVLKCLIYDLWDKWLILCLILFLTWLRNV